MPTPIPLTWQNRPLTVTAKVDAILNPTDTLLWTHEFIAGIHPNDGMINTLSWDGNNSTCEQGVQNLNEGRWSLTAQSGIGETVDIDIINYDTDNRIGTLSANGETVEVFVPSGESWNVLLIQNTDIGIATVDIQLSGFWESDGDTPTVTTGGNQLTAHWNYRPRRGVLTAHVSAYDGNNFLITTSETLTLTINSSGGGGS